MKTPRFLYGVKVKSSDRRKFDYALRHGVAMADFLQEHDDTLTPMDCLVMMKLELERGPDRRKDVFIRIKSNYNRRRKQNEDLQIDNCFPDE